jgi:hypothetical protein
MGSASNYLELELLDHVFKVGSYTAPSSLGIALHSADPTDAGTAATELSSAGGYARADATTAFGTAASSGAIANDAAITFGAASADWNGGSTIGYFSIWDQTRRYGGNMLFHGAITTPKAVLNGQTLSFPIGDIDVTCD